MDWGMTRQEKMDYRYAARDLTGFVQQVATAYLPHGYWFYSQGYVPTGKDVSNVDKKLIEKYGVARSKWQRARRKRVGMANLQYIRLDRVFLLMATKGRHAFFEEEGAALRDVRKVPIRIGGYSISLRHGPDGRMHSHVRIDQAAYGELMAHYLAWGSRAPEGHVVQALYNLPYEPYAPIRRQYLLLLKRLNEVRVRNRRPFIPMSALPLRRRIVRPFEESASREVLAPRAGPSHPPG